MKKQKIFGLGLFSAAIYVAIVLAVQSTQISIAGAQETDRTGNIGRGAGLWAQNCMRCHNMRDPKEFRDDLWKPIVTHMRIRAGLTGQDTRDILAFLQASN